MEQYYSITNLFLILTLSVAPKRLYFIQIRLSRTLNPPNEQRISWIYFSLLHADYVKLNSKWNYTNVISPYSGFIILMKGKDMFQAGRKKLNLSEAICTLFRALPCAIYAATNI